MAGFGSHSQHDRIHPISKRKLNHPSDLDHNFPSFEKLSRTLEGEEGIRENVLVDKPIESPPDGVVKTVYQTLERGATVSNGGKFLGEIVDGGYNWMNYETAVEDSRILGSAMRKLGLKAGENTRIGIAGIHNIRYLLAMHGMVSQSMVVVPLYHNSKLENLCEIIDHCELELIFCDDVTRAESFVEKKKEGNLKTFKTLVLLSGSMPEVTELQIYNYDEFYKLGHDNPCDPTPPKAEDLYLICHTSGTTGRPKGVMLTHRNVMAAVAGLYVQWVSPPNRFDLDHRDTYFSFLSLAHVYEHLMETFMMYIGGRVGIYQGKVPLLINNIQLLHPTIVSLVPRLLNKFYEHIHTEVSKKNVVAKRMFELAKKRKLQLLKRGIQRYDTIWDKVVFNKLRPLLGGRLRMLTTGGAPITETVKNFTRIAYGCPLMEGYGQTECGAAGTLNLPFEYEPGVVGGPAPWAQIKLADVPELGYYTSANKGEVCFRGAAVMKGYFGDEELTRKTVDDDGWLHTGDIGHWTSNNALAVIDRKNALFKMSQGDFVSPEQIEAVYLNSPLVTQIYVCGRTTRSFLVGVAIACPQAIRNIVQYTGSCMTDEELVEDEEVVNMVLNELNIVGKECGLQSIELIKHVKLVLGEWTADLGLVTPTMKLKRHVLKEKYKDVVDSMFDNDKSL